MEPATHGLSSADFDTTEGRDGADLLWQRIGFDSFARAVYFCIRALGYKTAPLRLTTGTLPISGTISRLTMAYLDFRSLIAGPNSGWPATGGTLNRRKLNPSINHFDRIYAMKPNFFYHAAAK